MKKPDWKKKRSLIETEKDLQNTVIDYLNKVINKNFSSHPEPEPDDHCRYYCRRDKQGNVTDKGYCPDLLVWVKYQKQVPEWGWCNYIVALAFEFKTPRGGGRIRPMQRAFLDWSCEAVNDYFVINDFDTFATIVQKALSGDFHPKNKDQRED